MTVIATDGRTMAADGLCLLHNAIISLETTKIRRLSSGALVGCAGESTEAVAFTEWLDAGGDLATWPNLKDCDALVLNPDGTIDLYEETNKGRSERVEAPIAIGSGMDFAIGAMSAGASPRRAVDVAILYSTTCGGKVVEKALKP